LVLFTLDYSLLDLVIPAHILNSGFLLLTISQGKL
jgi:hypothetical protein